ncbi:MAG: hypothetical protein ACYCZN_16190 [Candidatus Dormibacteria bacterium]
MIPMRPPWRGAGDDREPAERLTELARQIGRLLPDWRDPERYYERRSEIVSEIRSVARALESA